MLRSRNVSLQPVAKIADGNKRPTTLDALSSEVLVELLNEKMPLDTADGCNHRTKVIRDLELVVRKWITDTLLKQNKPKEFAETAGGKICISGSFRLNIHDPDADIDAVCLVPEMITRDDFFDTLYARLSVHPDVTKLAPPVREARVPLINMHFRGVEIDLQMARLAMKKVDPGTNILDRDILRGIAPEQIRSVNGPRDNEVLPHLVKNWDNFLVVLRAVRLWSKKRGVFKNKFGYLGGINCVILAAYACQRYPDCSPSMILRALFHLFARWRWKAQYVGTGADRRLVEQQPLRICKTVESDYSLYRKFGNANIPDFHPWNEDYARGRRCSCGCGKPANRFEPERNLMPMITPCYPAINSMKATWSTRDIIIEELQRAATLADGVHKVLREEKKRRRRRAKGQDSSSSASSTPLRHEIKEAWKRVFEPYCFPSQFDYFISIGCEATTQDHFDKWEGWLSSQLISFSNSTKFLARSGIMTSLRLWKEPCKDTPWWPRKKEACKCHCCVATVERERRRRGGAAETDAFAKDDDDSSPRFTAFWLFGVRLNRESLKLSGGKLDLRDPFNRFWYSEKSGPGAVMMKAMFDPEDPELRQDSLANMRLHMKIFNWKELKNSVPRAFLYEAFGGRDAVLTARKKRRAEAKGKNVKDESEVRKSDAATKVDGAAVDESMKVEAKTLDAKSTVEDVNVAAEKVAPLDEATSVVEEIKLAHQLEIVRAEKDFEEEEGIADDDVIRASWWSTYDDNGMTSSERPKKKVRLVMS